MEEWKVRQRTQVWEVCRFLSQPGWLGYPGGPSVQRRLWWKELHCCMLLVVALLYYAWSSIPAGWLLLQPDC
jgi:hypothetical protein